MYNHNIKNEFKVLPGVDSAGKCNQPDPGDPTC